MTKVYINGKEVFFKENTSLKLTIENTFFEDAGSYTLDVIFPLSIEQNRIVFGSINRMDVSKRYQMFEAMIIVDNKVYFKGKAKTTGVTEDEVKVQMVSGKTFVKFWSKAQKMYIDEFQYEYQDTSLSFDGSAGMDGFLGTPIITAGTFPGHKGVYCYVPTLDENGTESQEYSWMGLWNEHHLMIHSVELYALSHSNGTEIMNLGYYIEIARECISPNLMFVAKQIFAFMGYKLGRNDIDNSFVNSIYIANARKTTSFRTHDTRSNSADEKSMAKALPHWTVEEFIKQLQQFLNVTCIFDDINGTVDIIRDAYEDVIVDITGTAEDEYEVEIIDDEDVEKNLYDSNIKYKEGTSDYHSVDMVEREILDSFTVIECSKSEVERQWAAMSDEDKKQTIWSTPEGQYCAKINREGEGRQQTETLELIRFNHFGMLMRNSDNENDVELKISPVATTTEIEMPVFEWSGAQVYRDTSNYRTTIKQVVLCLQNQYEAANKGTVWDAIQDNQEAEQAKEDIMQVFLMDDIAIASGFYHLPYQMPFTHFEYNKPNNKVEHMRWSLSLDHDRSDYYIGQYHRSARKQNRNSEHRVRFIADKMPSVYSIFMIRNKRYACKKLEIQFTAEGRDKEILGYFEEIL